MSDLRRIFSTRCIAASADGSSEFAVSPGRSSGDDNNVAFEAVYVSLLQLSAGVV
jgi:hypothetical protein